MFHQMHIKFIAPKCQSSNAILSPWYHQDHQNCHQTSAAKQICLWQGTVPKWCLQIISFSHTSERIISSFLNSQGRRHCIKCKDWFLICNEEKLNFYHSSATGNKIEIDIKWVEMMCSNSLCNSWSIKFNINVILYQCITWQVWFSF